MATLSVKDILRGIEMLGPGDRLKLEKELAKRLNRGWVKETRKARRVAKRRKIDQRSIDLAIETRRYARGRFS